jgi:hypothetical protein
MSRTHFRTPRSGSEVITHRDLENVGKTLVALFRVRAFGDRAALSKAEAAQALGVSVDYLEQHVLPELATVRKGARVLIPVKQLEGWLDRTAGKALP